MLATSDISTRKVERPRARLSLAPMRVKMRSVMESFAWRGDTGAQVDEKLAFDFGDTLVGGEDFAFVFFQLGRGKTFGVDEGLFAFVVGGSEMEIGFGNLHVVAENGVEADFERIDAGAFAFALFHGGDDLFGVLAEIAKLVEVGVKARADDTGVRRERRRLIRESAFEAGADVGKVIEFIVGETQKCR